VRKRSSALHAESEEEYKVKLQLITEEHEKAKQRASISVYCPVTRFSAKEIIELHERQKKDKPHPTFEYSCWEEQETSPAQSKPKKRSSLKQSPELSEGRGSTGTSSFEENGVCVSNERKNDCMIIGGSKVGKHFLINSCFEEEHQDHRKESTFDMMVKSRACSDFNRKYHFWIHQLNNVGFDSIVKTYYKKIGLFIFVFDFASRESFAMLNDAIHKVLGDVAIDKFKAILLGNKTDFNSNKTVTPEEIENLRSSTGISEYVEMNFDNKSDYQNLLSKVDQYLFS